MPDDPRATLDALHAATDAQLAALLALVARALGLALTRAQDRHGTVAPQRLPLLRALLDDLIAGVFGGGPGDQFDAGGTPRTPIAHLVGASTRAATRLALAPVAAELAQRTQGDPALTAVLLTGRPGQRPPGARVPRVDSTRTWVDPNGYTLSDRLWQNGQEVRNAIDAVLQYHIERGTDAPTIGKALTEFLTPEGLQQRTRTPYGTQGLYAPRRLARTETTRAYGVATQEANRRNPWVAATGWRLSSSHPKQDVCDQHATADLYGLGPGNYPHDKVPTYPAHPQDLCYLTPVTVKDSARVVADLGRWARGEDVPALRDLPGDGLNVDTLVGTLTGIN